MLSIEVIGKEWDKFFFVYIRLVLGFTSNKPTYNLLDYGDIKLLTNASIKSSRFFGLIL